MRAKSYFLGLLAYTVTTLLYKTLRVVVCKEGDYDPRDQYLFAFWHGKQLLPVFELTKYLTKGVVLVSASRDGDILSVWLKKLGYAVLRGSSRHHNIRALVGMVRKLKEGYSLGFGIDGPIGPIYTVKPGMTYMAQKLAIPIIPLGSAFNRKWVVNKAWDKYEIPKPFTRAAFYLGKPLFIEVGTDLESWNEQLERHMHAAEAKALTLLNGKVD